MTVTLNDPISWESATGDTATMLDQLQPNILKAHSRDFLTVLFLKFVAAPGARTFLKSLVQPTSGAPLMKSAKTHLLEVKAFHEHGTRGTAYVGVGITAAGYSTLGVPTAIQPSDASFQAGMRAASTRAKLNDPPNASLDPHFRGDIHAVVLVGDGTAASTNAAVGKVRALLSSAVTVVGEETGRGLHNMDGAGIEHFGYVDGRSQPLFLAEDVDDERLHSDGTAAWNPAFAPSRVIVSDRAAPTPATDFGSYFVFRKLEQNVKLFKQQEEKLAARLKLTGEDVERAGAMIIGRFEDGTPLTGQAAAGMHNPVANNFNYDSDPNGGKCPFFGHIRKVNPRGTGGFESLAGERLHIMARRGQTYGERVDNPNDGDTVNKPTKDVGLLFMAFNADVAQQFEFVQATWANNPGFPAVPTGAAQPGLDLVIGQGNRPNISCPLTWGAGPSETKTTAPSQQAVTLKGGEYFFMPSLAFLRTL
jgi:Dyp-type peroxidase family